MTVLTSIWAWFQNLDARIWQAIIAGMFLASGWVVNGWQNRKVASREAAQARQDAADLRAERLRDVHRALFAEIGPTLSNLGSEQRIRDGGARILDRMRDDPDYHPFIPRLHRSVVFDAIVNDIHILPRTSIDAVVAFYGQLNTIESLIEDLRSDAVLRLPQARRMALYEDYTAVRIQAFHFGNHALRMIDAYAKGGKIKALEVEKEVSTLQSGGQYDP